MSSRHPAPKSSPPPPRHRPPLAAGVVQSLTTAIVTEEYPSGTALPPTGMLCEMYQVSRTVVREAITALAEKGLVTARQGWGTIVLDQSHWSLLDPQILDALFQRADRLRYLDNLIQIRITLECPMAAEAARRITKEEAAQLGAHLRALAALLDDAGAYASADIAFHDYIHRVSGDTFGRAIVSSLQGRALHTSQYSGNPTRAELELTHLAHTRVHDRILAGDAEGAAQAMREHITHSWARRRPEEP
ncbi:FadR/GntR family transcriptional regulator [Streptomyces johnsoniae]|uniref:FCD domain-containing protein n=1 Tax=Streptomyces johnsoniae TaxID=3075532 RepID=A0ABU2S705_9ACTN|nr:FCD domain-containing protein [Streptomyces sp. DSM 41886]MDT0444697.1 FCD domain-containing protein [Streptomyces sp. DSM 41886]